MLKRAVRALAAVDQDRASQQNRRGYSQADTSFGHELADTPDEQWTPAMERAAWEMLLKYSRQLADHGIDVNAIPVPAEVELAELQTAREAVVRARRERREAERRRLADEEGRYVEFSRGRGFKVHFAPGGEQFERDYEFVRALPRRKFIGRHEGGPYWLVLDTGVNYPGMRTLIDEYGFRAEDGVEERLSELETHAAQIQDKPERYIELDPKLGFVFTFPYDPRTFERLRTLQGFQRHPTDGRLWCAPDSLAVRRMLPDIVREYGFEMSAEVAALDFDEIEAEEELRVQAATRLDVDFEIDGFATELLPHQKSAAAYATLVQRCIFNDGHDAGDRLAALGAIHASGAYPAIIISDSQGADRWAQEIDDAFPQWRNSIQIIRTKNVPVHPGRHFYIVTHRAMSPKAEELSALEAGAIVASDAQWLSNPDAQRTRTAKALADGVPLRFAMLPDVPPGEVQAIAGALEFTGQLQDLGGYWPFINRFCSVERQRFGTEIYLRDQEGMLTELRKLGFLKRDPAELRRATRGLGDRALDALDTHPEDGRRRGRPAR